MKNKAFTLIELLVVVLIIGILAAIAVPQYQKAVLKSRATQALITVDAIYKAEESYYLANNKYTANFNKLDITLTDDKSSYYFYNSESYPAIELSLNGITIIYYLPNGSAHYTAKYCMVYGTDKISHEVCKDLTKKSQGSRDGSYTEYKF